MKQALKLQNRAPLLLPTLAILLVGLSACGSKNFESSIYSSKNNLMFCNYFDADLKNCDPGEGLHPVTQSAEVKANNDVDILFIVDNSGSMSEEQVGIGAKINGFLDKIKLLNWQIALTSTDPGVTTKDASKVQRPWGDGQFRPFDNDSGSSYILKSSEMTATSAQTELSDAIALGINGSGDERGINAVYRSIERSSTAGPQKDFFREGARLAVVVISDEDECSTGPSAECPNKGSSVPQNLINLVQQKFGTSKVFSFNSIVLDSTCTTSGHLGVTYQALSRLTGGLLGAVCAADYTAPLAALGNKVTDLVKSVSLSCQPQDVNKDNVPDVAIQLKDGSVTIEGFEVNGATVTFDEPLEEGTYDLYYYCKD